MYAKNRVYIQRSPNARIILIHEFFPIPLDEDKPGFGRPVRSSIECPCRTIIWGVWPIKCMNVQNPTTCISSAILKPALRTCSRSLLPAKSKGFEWLK